MVCSFCKNDICETYFSYYCSDCSKIKRYINLYDKRVIEILNSVLSRDLEKQNNKIKLELKNEIFNKKEKLDLQDSINLYDNKNDTKDNKELLTELKERIKKK